MSKTRVDTKLDYWLDRRNDVSNLPISETKRHYAYESIDAQIRAIITEPDWKEVLELEDQYSLLSIHEKPAFNQQEDNDMPKWFRYTILAVASIGLAVLTYHIASKIDSFSQETEIHAPYES